MIKKHNSKKKVYDVLCLTEKLTEDKRTVIGNLMHDFEAHQNDLLSELETKIKKTELSIRKHFQSLTLELPLNMQNYTIEQIRESGGGIDLNASGDDDRRYVVIRIAKSLTQSNNDSNSLLQNMTNKSISRHAFADVSAAVNSASKRNANHNSDNRKAYTIKLPLSATNKLETPNTNVRVLRSATKTNGTIVKSKIGAQNSVKPIKSVSEQSNTNTTIKAKITNTSTLDITIKTPLNPSLIPFLKKQPRKTVPNEEIIVCSKSGTPLVVDENVVNRIISSNNIKQLK